MSKLKPLRIAIMVNTSSVLEWQFQMLEKIQHNGSGEIVLAIARGATDQPAISTSTESPAKPNLKNPDSKSLATTLFYRFSQWDRKKFKQSPDPLIRRGLDELKGSIKTIEMVPEVTRWSDRLSHADAQTLADHDIDVIIRLGWRILKGDVLTIPRYGVWSYHHGDNRISRGGPPGVWEHFYDQKVVGVTLQILSEELDDGVVISRSTTARDRVSPTKTRYKLYWRSVDMLPRKLAELKAVGFDEFKRRASELSAPIEFYSKPLLTEKGMNLPQVVKYIGANCGNYLKYAIFQRQYEEKWVLYFKLAENLSTSPRQFTLLESPNDRYWADPHIIKRDGTFYVFVEEYMYDTQLGRIAVIPIDEDGTVGDAKTVLDRDYHLSYPFVFEHENDTYMVPESDTQRSIDLYKCVNFPDQWEYVKPLMSDVRAVDTTLYEKDGRWWMFTNRCDTEGGLTHDELHLYSANHFLDDEWVPVNQGVVVSDVRTARSAGALFEYNGKLFRPAQDCGVDYGYAVQLQEVTTLNESVYKETPVSRITPDWHESLEGVHTLSYVPGITVIDAKTFIKKSKVIA